MIYIDVIDQKCSLRRRSIAVRAEREMLCSWDRREWKVIDYDTVNAWLVKREYQPYATARVIFINAPDQEGWKEVFEVFNRQIPKLPLFGQIVSYSSTKQAPIDIGSVHPDNSLSKLWIHFSGVLAVEDYENASEAVEVGITNPPVEMILRKLIGHGR